MDLYERIKRNPSNVTPKQLMELLEEYGFENKGQEGDHVQYKKPGYRRFPIPIKQNPLAIHIVKEALRIIREIRDLD
ncbi:predicted periplasmic or secreted lipoprotein [Longilinea arvoryzae]|uniref:Predicted periplasmic or secreted lipoprotein n=1 Tax=Longilinea arvoryzae TaxID=360412 RepID=A0A0S7B769_9CHLR|nr:type II toxin-antitoxin system HicA family toxin [Longilinea arvoryzae]GAP12846.1 predicted periplasmic or secreted lipoprotein [Longilinea arvoryzae]